jgi:hypothetical protein
VNDEKPSIETQRAGPTLLEAARERFGQHLRACKECRVLGAPLCKKGAMLYRRLQKLAP